MVALANAVADPWTVVIVHLDAGLAVATVERPRRPQDSASSASRHVDLLVLDSADKLITAYMTCMSPILLLLDVFLGSSVLRKLGFFYYLLLSARSKSVRNIGRLANLQVVLLRSVDALAFLVHLRWQ